MAGKSARHAGLRQADTNSRPRFQACLSPAARSAATITDSAL